MSGLVRNSRRHVLLCRDSVIILFIEQTEISQRKYDVNFIYVHIQDHIGT